MKKSLLTRIVLILFLIILLNPSLAFALTWEDKTPAGTWTEIGFLADLGGIGYFRFRDSSNNAYLYEVDRDIVSNKTPAGAWKEIRFLAQISGKGYFSFQDSLDNYHFYVVNEGTLINKTPVGTWREIAFLADIGGIGYFRFLDSSNYVHLYEVDGNIITDITPPGAWVSIIFGTQVNGNAYFSFWNNSSPADASIYLLNSGTITNITPSGTWNGIWFLTEIGGKGYFRLQNRLNDLYFYEVDGSNWTNKTPNRASSWVHFLGEVGGKKYFSFNEKITWNYYIYEFNGNALVNITPAGNWKDIRFLAEIAGKGYFNLQDSSSKFHVYELDGNTWTDKTPAGNWQGRTGFLTKIENRGYFSFLDASGNYHIYEADGSIWTEKTPPGTWGYVLFEANIGGKGYFSFRRFPLEAYIYEVDGSNWNNQTPIGTWVSTRFLTEMTGKGYFSFSDTTFNAHVYELDGNTWSDQTPPGSWKAVEFLVGIGERYYFGFQDNLDNYHLIVAQASVFSVNSTNDADDGQCDSVHCSLREAINAANTSVGIDTIAFNIPGSGPHTIQPASTLPTITDPVIIDGYTQPEASPNTNPIELGLNTKLKIEIDGSQLTGASAFSRSCVIIASGNSLVRGLIINRCSYGILSDVNGGNTIQGNFIGTDVTGRDALGNFFGISVYNHSANNIIGGTTPETSNLISGNTSNGVDIDGDGNLVQGNIIGKDSFGTVSLPNGGQGVRADNSLNTTVRDNTIYGVLYFYNSSSTNITNNTISGGNPAIDLIGQNNHLIESNQIISNPYGGIFLEGVANSTIVSNTVAYNGDFGILIAGADSTENIITHNSIYDNNGLGIDLSSSSIGGVSPNDLLDVDTGPNSFQNFPILTSNPVTTTVKGTLNSSPNTEFRLELFTNDVCDPSGNGEGKTFISSTTVTTDNSGNVNFSKILASTPLTNLFVTATATDPTGNTSEFSNCVPTTKPITVVDDNAIIDEDLSIAIPVLSNDSDPNGQTLTAVLITPPGHGNATSNGTTITYTPTLNFYGTDRFTYKAANTYGVTGIATTTVTVRPVNDPPIFTSTPATNARVGEAYLYNITTMDLDISNTLTITTLSKPTWITLTQNSATTATLAGAPTFNDIGSYPVQLQVSDGYLTNTQTFSLAVKRPGNFLPVIIK